MKASTVVELAGFACYSAAGFEWRSVPVGLVVTGTCLLLVGLSVEDAQASVAIGRVIGPLRARRADSKALRASRRAEKRAVKRA